MNADHPMTGVAPEPGVRKPNPILIADGLQRSFGGLHAVDIDHLEIQRHTVTSLIGPNGAGKTTLFNLLTGFDKADAGEWHLNDGTLVGIAAFQVARRGMVRTFQLTRSLARLTVMDNMLVAANNNKGEAYGAPSSEVGTPPRSPTGRRQEISWNDSVSLTWPTSTRADSRAGNESFSRWLERS